MPAQAQPARRRPGRPRKAPVPSEPAIESSEAAKHLSVKAALSDERVGQMVDVPDCERITFHDDREYRVENGVIVERMR